MTQSKIANRESMQTTFDQTRTQSVKTTLVQDIRPYTAHLLYCNKPYKKQKVYWNQSAATWRHSSRDQSFSRQRRFRSLMPSSNDILHLTLDLPKSKIACTFGKGRRIPISQSVLKKARQHPAPNSYRVQTLNEETRSPKKGKSFCANWDKYQKVYLNHRKDTYSGHFVINYPSAKYDVRAWPEKQLRTFSSYGKDKQHIQSIRTQNKDTKSLYEGKQPRRRLIQRPWVS